LCHDLGITTIAEGIESESILGFLHDCGITYGQGFVFGSQEGLAEPQISK
jgi:EAL domain-containing protein (putative c-di-GMP-specific phosphodiesterase class I)